MRHTWEDVAEDIGVLGLSVFNSDNAAIHIYKASDVVVADNHTRESVTSGIGVWSSNRVAVLGNVVVNARNDDESGHEEWISIVDVADFEVAYNELYMEDATFDGHSAIDVKESSYRGSVHHNYIHDFNRSGQIYLDAWEAGLEGSFTLSHVDVYANLLVNAKGITVGSEQGGIVENVRIFNNIIVDSYSNAISISETGDGDGGNGPRRNIHIFNNTIHGTRNHGTAAIYLLSANTDNIVVQNNIVVLPDDRVVGLITAGSPDAAAHVTVNHNLVFGPTECANDHPECVELSGEEGNTRADPLFVDAEGGDFGLSDGSPGVDMGVAVDGLTTDYRGNSRPLGGVVDVGAIESF